MSSLFTSTVPASVSFPPGTSLSSAPPEEAASSQSLGIPSSIPAPPPQGFPPPPQPGENGHHSEPTQIYPPSLTKTETPPPAQMVSSAPDYRYSTEEFHPHNSAQKPEARTSRGPPKHRTPGQSPDGKNSSSGRRRTRTKVVAWDPRDLEDIYVRKEINKEDWDSICKDYPSRTRVAMRQQVIKMRERKQQELMGNHKSAKGSRFSDLPQTSSNGIKWASVNGSQSSPAEFESYSQGNGFYEEESSDDYELSSAPDTDPEAKSNRLNEVPSRSTPLQTRGRASIEPQPPPDNHIQNGTMIEPQSFNNQSHADFDVHIAQAKGKAIAPRQPPPPQAVYMSTFDDRQPVPPEFRPAKGKRGREFDATDSESRSSSNLSKRRKNYAEQPPMTNNTANPSEGFVVPYNPVMNMPAQSFPPPPPPPKVATESDLEDIWIRFRDVFRSQQAAYEQESRINKERYEAALGRANARAEQERHRADEESQNFGDQVKEIQSLAQVQIDHKHDEVRNKQTEIQKLQEQLSNFQSWKIATEEEAAKREMERLEKESQLRSQPDPSADGQNQSSVLESLQEELRQSKENAQRADIANNLLNEEVSKMRVDGKDTREKFWQIKSQHDSLESILDNLLAKDFEDLGNKTIKKAILEIKEVDKLLNEKVRDAEEFLNRPSLFTYAVQPNLPTAKVNGSGSTENT